MEFRVRKEAQLVQPYYYYRKVIHPSVSTKARHSLPEVVPSLNQTSPNRTSPSKLSPPSPSGYSNHLPPPPQSASRHLLNPYAQPQPRVHQYQSKEQTSNRKQSQPASDIAPSRRQGKLSVDYCIEHVPLSTTPSPNGPPPPLTLSTRSGRRNSSSPTNRPNSFRRKQSQAPLNKFQLLNGFNSHHPPVEDYLIRTEFQEECGLNQFPEFDTFPPAPTYQPILTQVPQQYFHQERRRSLPKSPVLVNQARNLVHHSVFAPGSYSSPDHRVIHQNQPSVYLDLEEEQGQGVEMLTHQSRSLPTGPPIPGARLNRTYSISSQGHIETAVRKGHRGSSPAIRTYNPEGFSFDVNSPPDSPPPIYHGSRSPSPLYVRAASLDINRTGSPCPQSPLADGNFHVATQHSSHSMDAYPGGKAPMLSPNSLCVRRASRCLSPLFIPPNSPKSPTDGNSSSSQPSASSTGPLSPSPMLGALQLELYLKKDIAIHLDTHGRITALPSKDSATNKKETGSNGVFPFPAALSNGHGGRAPGSLGRLHFRLKYDLDKSDLNLHVIQAQDLAKGDCGGFKDPYIRVFLTPEVDSRKRETTIHRNESDPFFEESFKFPVSQEDMKEKGLMLQVLDNDKYSRTDIVGEVFLALEDFDITTNLEVWADIVQNKKPSGEKQEILISLSYLPSAERLTVVLLKARNLHPPDNKDTIDPFVKVYLLGGGRRQKKKKTTARKNSKHPVWNEAFTFSITSANLVNCSIEISVLDQSNDLMGSHALIGSCMLGPHQKGSELTHWTEMAHNLRQTISMWHVLT